ncbi:MAG TPA: radical SAM family heme chaperone HemW [Verrucomicrobiales bacterium]|nr:radical SAM family heme chaperone HemW [Verrucomicrobiales bacterium]
MPIRRLYFHIPFCHRICPYCAFYKHLPGATAAGRVVEALLAELRHANSTFAIDPESIYFGGGTPSFLARGPTQRLLEGIRSILTLDSLKEWTLEANPRTFHRNKAALWKDAGINRVSLGVQSWTPRHLATLGRDHDPGDARIAFENLRSAGHDNVGIDLMFSLPGQTLHDWHHDLAATAALQPEHISCYNLTIEEDTEFFRRRLRGEFPENEHRNARLFRWSRRFLVSAGYRHYETSNYCLPGRESLHNRAYWTGEDFLGLGPGAVSTINGKRWRNLPDTERYCQESLLDPRSLHMEVETLSATDRHNERVALLLRTAEGLPAALLEPQARSRADWLAKQGLLQLLDGCYSLQGRARALVDPVAAELFV